MSLDFTHLKSKFLSTRLLFSSTLNLKLLLNDFCNYFSLLAQLTSTIQYTFALTPLLSRNPQSLILNFDLNLKVSMIKSFDQCNLSISWHHNLKNICVKICPPSLIFRSLISDLLPITLSCVGEELIKFILPSRVNLGA